MCFQSLQNQWCCGSFSNIRNKNALFTKEFQFIYRLEFIGFIICTNIFFRDSLIIKILFLSKKLESAGHITTFLLIGKYSALEILKRASLDCSKLKIKFS